MRHCGTYCYKNVYLINRDNYFLNEKNKDKENYFIIEDDNRWLVFKGKVVGRVGLDMKVEDFYNNKCWVYKKEKEKEKEKEKDNYFSQYSVVVDKFFAELGEIKL